MKATDLYCVGTTITASTHFLPTDFSDYIMFGDGITGEIIVNSKQQGKIVMDENSEYLTGARLYFDAQKMAHHYIVGYNRKVLGKNFI